MLRLTTNVTVSPASSARSSSAAWRMSSIASGRVSANIAVSSSALSATPVAALRDRARHEVGADRRRRVGAARAAPRDEAPVLDLDRVHHALARPTPGRCTAGTRTGARSARSRPPAAALRTWCGEGNGCSGEMWSPLALSPPRSVAPAAHELAPPVGEVRRDLDADIGHQPPRLGDQALHVLDASPAQAQSGSGSSRRAAVGDARAPVLARGRVGDLGRLLRRSSAGGGRSSAGSPPGCARARRAPRRAPPASRCAPARSRRSRRGSRS